jgi:hypothetical protein
VKDGEKWRTLFDRPKPTVGCSASGRRRRIRKRRRRRIILKSVEKIQVSLNLLSISGTLHEDQCKFMIISLSVLLRMRNVADEVVKKCKRTFYIQ